jgi:hypothetical protein
MKKLFLLLLSVFATTAFGQINPVTLKNAIDNTIINVNTAGGISRANVGGNMKNCVDYTTQQAALKENTANKSTDTALGSSDILFPTQNAVKTYVDNNTGGTSLTYGVGSPGTSFPYPVTTFDITRAVTTAPNQRLGLKAGTFNQGDTQTVFNVGSFPLIVFSTGHSFISVGVRYSSTAEVLVYPNESTEFFYVNGSWQIRTNYGDPLVYSVPIYQSGTNPISPQSPVTDTLTWISGSTAYRYVDFERLGVGDYAVYLEYNTSFVDANLVKSTATFGDATCRIYAVENSGSGSLLRKTWKFKTYTPSGVLSDGLLLGNGGAVVTVTMYTK